METSTPGAAGFDPAADDPLKARARIVRRGRLRRSLIGLTIVAGIVLAPLTTPSPDAHPLLRDLVIMLGTLLIAGGAALRLWAGLYIGGHKERELVTTGPYSCVRNPLYLGNLLAATGIAAMTGSIDLVVFTIAATAAVYIATINQEQDKLRPIFGAAYDDYLREVPRLLPRLDRVRRLIHDATPCTVTHRSMARELGRCAGLVALGLIALLLTSNAPAIDTEMGHAWHRVAALHPVAHHLPTASASHPTKAIAIPRPHAG